MRVGCRSYPGHAGLLAEGIEPQRRNVMVQKVFAGKWWQTVACPHMSPPLSRIGQSLRAAGWESTGLQQGSVVNNWGQSCNLPCCGSGEELCVTQGLLGKLQPCYIVSNKGHVIYKVGCIWRFQKPERANWDAAQILAITGRSCHRLGRIKGKRES